MGCSGEKEISATLTIKGRGRLVFLLYSFWLPGWDSGTPHLLQSLQMGSWENWQKLAKGENSYQSQLSQISIYGVWLRDKVKISRCSFLSKFRLAGKKTFVRIRSLKCDLWICFHVPIDHQSFLLHGQLLISHLHLPVCLILCSQSPTDCCQLSGVRWEASWNHSGCNLILWRIKNNCTSLTNLVRNCARNTTWFQQSFL